MSAMPDQAARERSYGLELVPLDGGELALRLHGALSFEQAGSLWSDVTALRPRIPSGETLWLDVSEVERIDGGSVALLSRLRADLCERGIHAEFRGAAPRVHDLIHLYGGDVGVRKRPVRRPRGMLEQVGCATYDTLREIQLVLAFLGQMVEGAWRVLRSPRSANWREVAPTLEVAGADAVPIVSLINFLVGLIMAYQASVQLMRFGANILVADLIGISITRELGPLMTAIVVSGRSGAAFAAELGSMRVNEEIDALRTMGLGPMRYLVLPRAVALMIAMPLLSLLADLVGVLGGLFVAVFHLRLTAVAYFNQAQRAVDAWDVWSGLIKSVVFGLAIALIACEQGLAASGGAEGVGRRTTAAVVITLFTLIVIDAVFTVFFRVIGL